MSLNIHIYPSVFTNETRILKIVRTLHRHRIFNRVLIVAVGKDGLPEHEIVEDGIEILRVSPMFGRNRTGRFAFFLKAIGWYFSVFSALRQKNVSCLNCHSLSVLPLTIAVSFWKRCCLVYEPHELETETMGLYGLRKRLMRATERSLIGKADAVCVVNRSIADWYKKSYKLDRVWVIRNVPNFIGTDRKPEGVLRSATGISSGAWIFLYQGLLAPGRGVSLLIEAFSKMSEHHLVFMGYGELETFVRKATTKNANIHFMTAVPPDELWRYTIDADVGISLIEDKCKSYYLSLPNKVFEYLSCGLPAIVSNFPEVERLVGQYDCGWNIAPDERELRSLVKNLTREAVIAKAVNTKKTILANNWQLEERVLLKMYKELGFDAEGAL